MKERCGDKRKTLVLVHGYFKNSRDMGSLKKFFEKKNFQVFSPDLPTTASGFEQCAVLLKLFLDEKKLSEKKLHFVGHSMGGLIIRKCLMDHRFKVGPSVFIATPNQGASLADRADKIAPLISRRIGGLKSLKKDHVEKVFEKEKIQYEAGVLAGDKNHLVLGKILGRGACDGRVLVEETYLKGIKDHLVLPYHHKEIHHKETTLEYTGNFIDKGVFKGEQIRKEGKK